THHDSNREEDGISSLSGCCSLLLPLQADQQVVRLDGSLCGLVEGWANGCDWTELTESTSLDGGDLCRILRRSMEMLRQMPTLPGISPILKDRSVLAAAAIDRFPVSDDTTYLV
ncbi:unnamed protein product, partial [Discosporangium mesarthrocarpum]